MYVFVVWLLSVIDDYVDVYVFGCRRQNGRWGMSKRRTFGRVFGPGCSMLKSRSCTSKGIWRRGIGSAVRNPHVSTLCPVVICPYLCTSEREHPGCPFILQDASPPIQDSALSPSPEILALGSRSGKTGRNSESAHVKSINRESMTCFGNHVSQIQVNT